MHTDELRKKISSVINRAEKGESLTNDDLIVKAAGTLIRLDAVKIEYAKARGERPFIAELTSEPVASAGRTLQSVQKRKAA